MIKYLKTGLLFSVTSFTVFSGDIEKGKKVNWSFSELFFSFSDYFFSSPDSKSEKKFP